MVNGTGHVQLEPAHNTRHPVGFRYQKSWWGVLPSFCVFVWLRRVQVQFQNKGEQIDDLLGYFGLNQGGGERDEGMECAGKMGFTLGSSLEREENNQISDDKIKKLIAQFPKE